MDDTKLAAARLRAAEVQPFLAVALYALSPVEKRGSNTFAVDRQWRLYVDPAALERWSVRETAGVLLHEVGHLVRDHAGRAEICSVWTEQEAHWWNLAADAEINDDLRSDEIILPSHVLPETLREPPGKAAEFYFDRLRTGRARDIDHPDCGSGCHGLDEAAHEIDLAVPGLSDIEAMLLRRRVAEELVAYAGQHPGSVGAGWERWAEALLNPQLDWRRLLRGSVRASVASVTGMSDYAYRRPSRRRIPKVVLPSLHKPVPRVTIIVDTSASVDDELLGSAMTEVQGCLRSIGVRRDLVRVLATDTETTRVSNAGARRIKLTGGGGTDMGAGIEFAMNDRPAPNIVVVLTDGYTPWPTRAPNAKVIVGFLESIDDPFGPPPDAPRWAKVVRIKPAG